MEEIEEKLLQLYNHQDFNILILLAIIVSTIIAAPLLAKLITILLGYKGKTKKCRSYIPLKCIVYILGFYIGIVYTKLPEEIFSLIRILVKISIIGLTTLILIDMVRVDSVLFRKLYQKMKETQNETIITFFSNVLKGILVIVGFFVILSELDFNINGLLASLGIGGIIVALAAQDVAKNFFGGVAIIFDKPFKVGDWIETLGLAGTVQDISLRSTRIKQFNNTIITIPNSTLANAQIINWGELQMRRYITHIILPLETPSLQIEKFIKKAYTVLENTQTIVENSININFDEIQDCGFKIYIYMDTTVISYTEYLKFKEMINYQLVELVKQENLTLAYPTQTVYMKNK